MRLERCRRRHSALRVSAIIHIAWIAGDYRPEPRCALRRVGRSHDVADSQALIKDDIVVVGRLVEGLPSVRLTPYTMVLSMAIKVVLLR
jgi:hypothetical protein